MKELRKNKQGFFICEECGFTTNNARGLSTHIQFKHNNKKYYDKWLKESDDGICKICGNETKFIKISDGYLDTCSRKCCNIHKNNILKEVCLLNYGVNNISKLEEIKKKKEETCLKNYGVKAGFADVKKRNKTNIERFGFENPNQNKEIHEKGQKTRLYFHKFKDTNIWYQGSFELDFLEIYFYKYPDMLRGPSIKYKFNGKNKVYHSDFYIPSLNLVIECKNSYLAKKDEKQIEAKEKATIANGFNYIMILDKNYSECSLSFST
jgi:hypothetical protein